MAEIDWEATARKAGWQEGFEEPHGKVLHHADLDRIWPLNDWEGAVRDLGFEENHPDWVDEVVYLPEQSQSLKF